MTWFPRDPHSVTAGWLSEVLDTDVRACWLEQIAPDTLVARLERVGAGRDGERYAWERLVVLTVRDGRLASVCEFDSDDADAALAYAQSVE